MPVHRLRFLAACATCVAVIAWGSTAFASAQVSKFSIVLSANPTSVAATDFNDKVIDGFNHTVLDPRGLRSIDRITSAWVYDIEGHYFLRSNFAIDAGVGQLRSNSKRDFLPAIGMAIGYRAELLSVPVHVGGAYYLPPYNSGDFQARWFIGGGMLSNVYNRARFSSVESRTDSARTLAGNYMVVGSRDSPGYYFESGAHMFFASRYSVQIGGIYRSSVVRGADAKLIRPVNGKLVSTPLGKLFDIDNSGYGAKLGLAIGF